MQNIDTSSPKISKFEWGIRLLSGNAALVVKHSTWLPQKDLAQTPQENIFFTECMYCYKIDAGLEKQDLAVHYTIVLDRALYNKTYH